MNYYLFLDIDGVMHPFEYSRYNYDTNTIVANPAIPGATLFSNLGLLENMFKERPELQVIIHSNWRLIYTEEKLRDLLPPAIVQRLAGVTDPSYKRWASIEIEVERRQKAGEAFKFAILDDERMPSSYRYKLGQQFFQTNSSVGLTEGHVGNILESFNS